MSRKVTTVQIDGNFGRANTGVIEKCIQSSFEAVNGHRPDIMVTQINDRTLDITIIEDRLPGRDSYPRTTP